MVGGGGIRGFCQVEMPANAIVPSGSIKRQRSFSHIFLSFCSAVTVDTVSKHKVDFFFFKYCSIYLFSDQKKMKEKKLNVRASPREKLSSVSETI